MSGAPESVGIGRDESGKIGKTHVTMAEMNWISMVCYLGDEASKRYIFECAESLAPCPLRDVMERCQPPKEGRDQ